ncbi:GbsR/MarR family transcriptional regulator [Myceligenerans pegani]|uniref:MarR family transcriptional regulator n=1 Tax=Myceligenerans pegani TaxID=2776917 RepID=A0ABR9N0Q6_9MICO|nr:MarR family transcriptional regulator [Myceligenerans sp. TRM 65318]MBE1876592.1 MarR family transcriptional regulator [Myceligenerans sp. TRM 65318]MBE3018863.1 MarR family transcriptional regulator [Myceligenerans sp. TRM 65318]
MADHADRFIERFAGVLARSGWPRMSARMFASLMTAPDGTLTATDLADRLGVGPSAISNGAKMLRTLGLVDTTRRSDRQLVYEVRPDAWVEATISQDDNLRALEVVLTEGARNADDERATARLLETADFFAFLRTQLPALVEQWRSQR